MTIGYLITVEFVVFGDMKYVLPFQGNDVNVVFKPFKTLKKLYIN